MLGFNRQETIAQWSPDIDRLPGYQVLQLARQLAFDNINHVNGDRDSFVKLEEVEAALEPYGPQWHVLEGVGHTITDRHRELVSAFIASFG